MILTGNQMTLTLKPAYANTKQCSWPNQHIFWNWNVNIFQISIMVRETNIVLLVSSGQYPNHSIPVGKITKQFFYPKTAISKQHCNSCNGINPRGGGVVRRTPAGRKTPPIISPEIILRAERSKSHSKAIRSANQTTQNKTVCSDL